MPLTPTDVANKQFKIVFRGYSLDEVDGFLDEVESELTRLMRDNNDLRNGGDGNRLVPAFTAAAPVTDLTKPAGGHASPAEDATVEGASVEGAAVEGAAVEGTSAEGASVEGTSVAEVPAQAGAPAEGGVRPDAHPQAADSPVDPDLQRAAAAGDGGRAALRMLQMAQQTAEQAVAEARAEAAAILTPARSEADATLAAARAEADRLLTDARDRAAATDAEIATKVEHAMGDLDVQRAVLERNIEQLREFEREYRRRLTSYLEGQLQELGSTGTAQELEAPQAVELPADGEEHAGAPIEVSGDDGSTSSDTSAAPAATAPADEAPRSQGWS